jgi:hypothetical protein
MDSSPYPRKNHMTGGNPNLLLVAHVFSEVHGQVQLLEQAAAVTNLIRPNKNFSDAVLSFQSKI